MRMGLAALLALAVLGLSACARAYADCPTEIRVVLSDSGQTAAIGGALSWHSDGQAVGDSTDAVSVKCVDSQVKVTLGGKGVQSDRLVAFPASGYVRFGNRQYRGRIELFVGKGGGLVVLNVLPIEDYLLGVVPSEMPSKWPLAALEAQAVAARTYAISRILERKDETFDVYASVDDQAYLGVNGESASAAQAVKATAGQIVTYNGKPIVAYYCSDAGGCTKCGKEPYLQAVPIESPDSPHNAWRIALSRDDLSALAGRAGGDIGTVQSVRTEQDPQSGHLTKLSLTGSGGKLDIAGNKLRSLLGLNVMKSTRAWVEIVGQDAPPIPAVKSALPPKEPKVEAQEAGEVVEIGAPTTPQVFDDGDGETTLPPFAKPYVAFDGGVGGKKLRDAYASDGNSIASCAKDMAVQGLADAGSDAVPVQTSKPQVAKVKKTTSAVQADAELPAAAGPVGAAGIIIHGSGYGHGLGMSQWGAKTLAERGMAYEDILTYFYSGVRIEDVPGLGSAKVPVAKVASKSKAKADESTNDDAVEIKPSKFAPGR